MANTTTAIHNGFNYQARIFWLHAFKLLRPETHVHEVIFESASPKGFDDVVVLYDTPIPRGGTERITEECYQIKWHVSAGGRFGFEHLTDPQFISAKSVSLLQRLRDAVTRKPDGSAFVFLTTDRIADSDPLSGLISKNDHSILLEKLFSTRTDNSLMGSVRACWRKHLKLESDQQLKPILSKLRIFDGYRSLEELRQEVNTNAVAVGLKPDNDARSDFRYDDLAQKLNGRKIDTFNRGNLVEVAKEEGLWVGTPIEPVGSLLIAIHSFLGLATDLVSAEQDNTLHLNHLFRQRYLEEGREWQADIKPLVESFLTDMAHRSSDLRLVMNAHASIAYLAGTVYHVKSGIHLELMQKGIVGGLRAWCADDRTAGDALKITNNTLGGSPDIAVGISITQSVEAHMQRYIDASLPSVGHMVTAMPHSGPGQQCISGGQHSSKLAQQLAQFIREVKIDNFGATVHVFAACPNSFLFYLGQQHQWIGPVIVYEFDFDGQGNKGYQPSFLIE
ncbi:MAG: hypothetical protein C0631_15510 [Sedimenticola sp.]|nr:MAG: hypothetical protein C0631_15510 [Sedimenticola sp.]